MTDSIKSIITTLVNKEFLSDTRERVQVDCLFLKQLNVWRKEIGEFLYSKDEKYRDEEVMNDAVQTFINQVIFLRICEDNELPIYQNLKIYNPKMWNLNHH